VDGLRSLLVPSPAGLLVADPVSGYVGKARIEGPRCLEPA
jgi:hypothetical protein